MCATKKRTERCADVLLSVSFPWSLTCSLARMSAQCWSWMSSWCLREVLRSQKCVCHSRCLLISVSGLPFSSFLSRIGLVLCVSRKCFRLFLLCALSSPLLLASARITTRVQLSLCSILLGSSCPYSSLRLLLLFVPSAMLSCFRGVSNSCCYCCMVLSVAVAVAVPVAVAVAVLLLSTRSVCSFV